MIAFLRNDLEVPVSSVRRLPLAATQLTSEMSAHMHLAGMVLIVGASTFDRLLAASALMIWPTPCSRMSTPKARSPYTANIALSIKGREQFSCRGSSSVRGAEGSAMNTHRTVLAIFAAAFVIAVVTAFLTILHNVDPRSASTEAPPGTIGLARPHPPLPPHAGQN